MISFCSPSLIIFKVRCNIFVRMTEEEGKQVTWRETYRVFLREFLEALTYLYVISIVAEKPTPFTRLARLALSVGIVQALVYRFDNQSHSKIKDGMYFTVGSTFLGL